MNVDLYRRALDCIAVVPGRMCFANHEMRRAGVYLTEDIIDALILLLDRDDEALEKRVEDGIGKLRRWMVDSL